MDTENKDQLTGSPPGQVGGGTGGGATKLQQDGLWKALEGSTTIEEVMRVTSE